MSTVTEDRTRQGARSGLVLVGFLVLCFAVAGIAGAVTSSSVETWYPTLEKPAFTPPDWVFGPVWTALYAMMALAAWLVWRRTGWSGGRNALGLFLGQLALNLAWSVLFFGLQQVGWALVEIVVLLALILATTMAFFRIDWRAGALLVPYLLWVGYAGALNAGIWALN